MPGPTLRLVVDSDVAPEEIQRELEWAVRRHPAGRWIETPPGTRISTPRQNGRSTLGPDVADLRARLAAAEAECARLASRRGRARARTADAITAAGAAVHAAARALAERVAP